MLQRQTTGGRQVDATHIAREQHDTELPLQSGDPVGYRCLRCVQTFRGCRKAAQSGSPEKSFEESRIHGLNLLAWLRDPAPSLWLRLALGLCGSRGSMSDARAHRQAIKAGASLSQGIAPASLNGGIGWGSACRDLFLQEPDGEMLDQNDRLGIANIAAADHPHRLGQGDFQHVDVFALVR